MRGLMLLGMLALATPSWSAPGADPTPPNGLTDREGVAGGATAPHEHSPRQDYARDVESSLAKWDHRIDELKGASSKRARNATAILEEMKRQTHADLSELQQVRGDEWKNVKARIEARMRRMDKEYRFVYAE